MTAPQYISPPTYAKRLGIKADKVIGWIRAGELRAIDVSTTPGKGRPRFRIPFDAIIEFEQRRSIKPPMPRAKRRKRRAAEVIQYF